jgi:hypothetical protein
MSGAIPGSYQLKLSEHLVIVPGASAEIFMVAFLLELYIDLE